MGHTQWTENFWLLEVLLPKMGRSSILEWETLIAPKSLIILTYFKSNFHAMIMKNTEVARFLIVGSATVLVDYFSYLSFLHIVQINVNIAKGLSFLLGTVFSYFVNKSWTFTNSQKMIRTFPLFILLYCLTMGINVSTNFLILNLLENYSWAISIAFLASTILSACLNFVGMKFVVFRGGKTLWVTWNFLL